MLFLTSTECAISVKRLNNYRIENSVQNVLKKFRLAISKDIILKKHTNIKQDEGNYIRNIKLMEYVLDVQSLQLTDYTAMSIALKLRNIQQKWLKSENGNVMSAV